VELKMFFMLVIRER